MACDVVRRALSDGDRRTLRAVKMRSHLRACAGCRDFQAALDQRPARLAAIAPPLPLAVGASMLHGILGGAGHGAAGGGLGIGVTAGTKAAGMLSVSAAKVATVAVIASSVAGAGVYIAPTLTRDVAQPVNRPAAASHPTARHDAVVVAQRARQDSLTRGAAAATAARKATTNANTAAAGRMPAVPAVRRHAASPPGAVSASTRPRPAAASAHAPARAKTASGAQAARAARRPTHPGAKTTVAVAPVPVRSTPATVPARVAPTAPVVTRAPVPDAPRVAAPNAAAPVPPRPR